MMAAWMNYRHCLPLVTILMATPAAMGATKEQELPDKELLKMMDLLRDMEMIKQLEMIRELERAESPVEPVKNTPPQKPALAKKKEASK